MLINRQYLGSVSASRRGGAMFKVDDRARKGWISLGVIGAIGAAVMAMTTDAHFDTRRDARDAMHTSARADGPWCILDRDSRRDCGYLTFAQCLQAGNAIGGTCRPNPATHLITDDGPYRTYRSIYLDHPDQRL
jgi:hypothetical protein